MLKKELVKIFLPVNRFEAANEFEPNFSIPGKENQGLKMHMVNKRDILFP